MRALRPFVLASLALSAFAAHAAEPTEVIRRMFAEKFPKAEIRKIVPSRYLPGFYDVLTSEDVIYVDAGGKVLILGTLVDTATQENLTAKRWSELHPVEFASLPLDLAIKSVRGNGERTLVVFADPDCPYCQALEQEMTGLTNATVYTFLFPIEALHPDARNKAGKIWCSQPRDEVWTQWMTKQAPPTAAADCGAPLDRLLSLAHANEIRSTPTLVFRDGSRIEGGLTLTQLEAALNARGSGK